LWKEDGTRWLKLLVGVLNLVPFCPIWGNDELRACEKERFISNGMSKDDLYSKVMGLYVKYWESILELLSRPSHGRVLFCWKAFGLLAIGELIMSVHPFLLLWMLTLRSCHPSILWP